MAKSDDKITDKDTIGKQWPGDNNCTMAKTKYLKVSVRIAFLVHECTSKFVFQTIIELFGTFLHRESNNFRQYDPPSLVLFPESFERPCLWGNPIEKNLMELNQAILLAKPLDQVVQSIDSGKRGRDSFLPKERNGLALRLVESRHLSMEYFVVLQKHASLVRFGGVAEVCILHHPNYRQWKTDQLYHYLKCRPRHFFSVVVAYVLLCIHSDLLRSSNDSCGDWRIQLNGTSIHPRNRYFSKKSGSVFSPPSFRKSQAVYRSLPFSVLELT